MFIFFVCLLFTKFLISNPYALIFIVQFSKFIVLEKTKKVLRQTNDIDISKFNYQYQKIVNDPSSRLWLI